MAAIPEMCIRGTSTEDRERISFYRIQADRCSLRAEYGVWRISQILANRIAEAKRNHPPKSIRIREGFEHRNSRITPDAFFSKAHTPYRSAFTVMWCHCLERSQSEMCITWCLSHRYNLAVQAVIKCSTNIQETLQIAEDAAKIFRSSYNRMNVWIEVAKNTTNWNSLRRMKLIGTTQRSFKQDAIATIVSSGTNLFVLLKALIKTCNLERLGGSNLESF